LFKKYRLILFLLIINLLSACGFHLQGAFKAPSSMELTYVATNNQYSAFYRELRLQLLSAGVKLSDSPADATAILNIHSDQTSQRVLSVSARNVPTEYEVFYTINYSLNSGQYELIPRQTLTLTRDYIYNSTLVLGKEREEELIRDAITKDLVRVVLKQISTL
tara:strand:+ start:1160 stop:1648 length:489 start_codon:yes stop_codon:yes gene_type:complete